MALYIDITVYLEYLRVAQSIYICKYSTVQYSSTEWPGLATTGRLDNALFGTRPSCVVRCPEAKGRLCPVGSWPTLILLSILLLLLYDLFKVLLLPLQEN